MYKNLEPNGWSKLGDPLSPRYNVVRLYVPGIVNVAVWYANSSPLVPSALPIQLIVTPLAASVELTDINWFDGSSNWTANVFVTSTTPSDGNTEVVPTTAGPG